MSNDLSAGIFRVEECIRIFAAQAVWRLWVKFNVSALTSSNLIAP